MTVRLQVPSDNKPTQEHWRSSYVPVMSTGVGNGSTAVTPTAKPRPTSALPINQPTAAERKKRKAPEPPGPLKTLIGSPNGSISSGFEDSTTRSSVPPTESSLSSSSPVTDNRTMAVTTSVGQLNVKPERMKRPAPTAPGFPASGPADGRLSTSDKSAAERNETAGRQNVSMLGRSNEITLNMHEVEFVPPERPKTWHITSPGQFIEVEPMSAVPTSSANVNVASLSTTKTEGTAVDSQNDTLTDTPPSDSDDGKRCLETDEQDVKRTIESTVERSSLGTDRLVSDVVNAASVTPVQSSKVGNAVDGDIGSLARDHDVSSLQQSASVCTYAVSNPPNTHVTTQSALQTESEHDEHTKTASPEQNQNSMNAVQISEDERDSAAEISSSRLAEQPVAEETTSDDQSPVNSVESTSSVATQPEPSASFKVSEKEVKQKKDELSSTSQPTFDTSWQSTGDGGRFRIRSVAKNVSYTEVFGENESTGGKTPNESREFVENSNRGTGITTDTKPVDNSVAAMYDNVGCETGEQKPVADNQYTQFGTETVITQHQQIDHEAPTSMTDPSLKPELGNSRPDANAPVEKIADNSEVSSSSVSVDSEKSTVEPAGSMRADPARDLSAENATSRRPETIVINKSNISSAGGLSRRSHGASRSPSGAKVASDLAQSSESPAASAASAEGNRLHQRSELQTVSDEIPRTESAIDARIVAAEPAERVSQPVQQESKSTVVQVVNGCIVRGTAPVPSAAVSKPPPTQQKATGKSNVSVVHCNRSANDNISTQSKTEGDGKATGSLTNSEATPDITAKTGVDVQPSVTEPVVDLSTSTTRQFHASNLPSPSGTGDMDSKPPVENPVESAEIVIPEWRRVTTTKTLPKAVPQLTAGTGLQASNTPKIPERPAKAGGLNYSGRKTTDSGVSPTVRGAQVRTVQVRSATTEDSSAVNSKQSSVSQNRSTVPADTISATASTTNSAEEESNPFLAQARSMLRPTYKTITYEVPPANDGDSATSKFVLRSASSSVNRNFMATDVDDKNLEHKPEQVGIGSKTPAIASQSHSTSVSPLSAGTSSTLPTSVRDNSRRSLAESSPALNDFDTTQMSASGIKPKPRSKAATSMLSDSRVVDLDKPEKDATPLPPRPAASSSRDVVKRSPVSSESEADSGAVNPAAAALASLQPAKLRRPAKPVIPPRLTLHEQLMIAIRDVGGSVPAATSHPVVPCRPRSVDASVKNSTPVPFYRSISHEPTSSGAAAGVSAKPTVSPPVVMAKKTSKTIEPPKPTPHEQLMKAIRTAGGVTSRRSADMDRSDESTAAYPSSASTSVVDTRAEAPTVEPSTNSPQISCDGPLTDVNGLSETRMDERVPSSQGPPPPPALPSLPPTSTAVPEAPKASPRKQAPAARPRTTPQPQPDAREALLAAIRDAGGGKGLRKVTANVLLFSS